MSIHVAFSEGTRFQSTWAAIWCKELDCPGEPRIVEARRKKEEGANILLWRPGVEGQISLNEWGTLDFALCPHLEDLVSLMDWKEDDVQSGEEFSEFCRIYQGNVDALIAAARFTCSPEGRKPKSGAMGKLKQAVVAYNEAQAEAGSDTRWQLECADEDSAIEAKLYADTDEM